MEQLPELTFHVFIATLLIVAMIMITVAGLYESGMVERPYTAILIGILVIALSATIQWMLGEMKHFVFTAHAIRVIDLTSLALGIAVFTNAYNEIGLKFKLRKKELQDLERKLKNR